MALNKKLIHFKKREFFDRELANGNVLDTSICFIQDETLIYTHGTFYDGSTFDPTNIEQSLQNILNTKQDKIEDIENIRAGAALGVTALQSVPSEYITETELNNKGYATTTSVNTGLSNKVDKETGKGLSTNDYTTTEKSKLAGISSGAEVNQNTYSAVKVGNNTISAGSKTDTLNMSGSDAVQVAISNNTIIVGAADASTSSKGVVKVGSNISVDSGTISVNANNITNALGYTPPQVNTVYEFKGGTNGFSITPTGGESQTVPVVPSITNNVTYDETWTGGKVAILDAVEGVIKASPYSLGKDVPSTAKLTDTTYSEGSGIVFTDSTTINHADTSSLNGSYGPTANVTGDNNATIVIPQITVDGYGHVTGVTNRTYTSKNTTYNSIAASELNTGTDTTNKLISAKVISDFVKNQIDNKIAAADAMIYKGTIGTNGTVTSLPNTTAKTGWTYKVTSAGTYAGQACEVGDMIICLTDGSELYEATWNVIQTNSPSHVTGPGSVTTNTVAIFDGTSGKAIKSSNLTIETAVPKNALFTDSKVTSVENHYTPAEDDSSQLVASGASATDITGTSMQVVTGLQRDAKGHVVGVISGSVKATNNTYTALPNPNSITYKVNDNTLYSYNGNAAKTLTIKNGTNISVTGDTDGNITISGPTALKNPKSIKLLVNDAEKITYDGNVAKSINLKAGSNITLSGDTDGNVTIAGTSDTKVTSAANHYTPEEDTSAALSVDASSSTAATWGTTNLVTGVNLTRDSKGHVTGLSVDSIKMPSNPNSNTTYTFANGTNGFTVTPSNGSAQTVAVTPSILNNVTYDGTLTSGQVAIFEGTSGKIKASGITMPSNPKFTDTTYDVVTTTSGDTGLMSSDMLNKLNNIAAYAEVNVQSNWNETNTSSDAYIKNKPSIPTESTVTGWGFTKNTGTYSKPSDGIPLSDLTTSIQASLGLANSALQSFTETDPIFVASAASKITTTDITNWNNKGTVTKVTAGTGLTGGDITSAGIIALSTSGVTKGSYGLSTNVAPGYNNSFNVPYITVDEYGRITSASTKTVTLPSSDNTWRPITNSVSTIDSDTSASATAVKSAYDKAVSAYDLAASKTANVGTVTGIKMNGTAKNPTNGVVDLGTVITAHQDISGKLDSSTAESTYATKTELSSSLSGKQDTISDLGTIRNRADNGNTAYGWGNHANAGYANAETVNTAINNVDAKFGGLKLQKVSSMPDTPDANTLYILV